ncbi:MAG TPA: hypothetical protein VNC78_11225 [Actinomycetota bacterium]|nr:hypothetical protein [Actinomycetota bacterium]
MTLLARFKRDAVATAVIAALAIGAFGFVAITPKDGGYTQLDLAAKKCKKKGNNQQKKKCKKKKSTASPRPTGTTAPSGTPSPTTSGAPTPAPTGGGGAPAPDGGASKCAPYTPGELGTGAETAIVTAAHTAEAPLEVPITIPQAVFPAVTGDTYLNVQVAAGAASGLYVRFVLDAPEDNDLYMYNADGTTAAQAAGFNPVAVVPVAGDAFNAEAGCCVGGHSEFDAEQIDGVNTPSCGGYTLELHSFMTMGGERTVQLWLGEVLNEPGTGAAVMK